MKAWLNRLLIAMAVGLLRLLFASCRARFSGVDNIRAAEAHCGGYLLGMWHEHAITGSAGYVNQPLGALVSPSKDGSHLAYLFVRMGVVPVRGSSSRRGKQARGEVRTFVRAGVPIAISVDGPKGPHRVCKPGIVDLARTTGAPILPGVAYAERAWTLGTWDGLQIPKPFSRLLMHHGTPIHVPEQTDGADFEAVQRAVEDAIARTYADAEREFAGWSGIAPGSPRNRVTRRWVKRMLLEHGTPLGSADSADGAGGG